MLQKYSNEYPQYAFMEKQLYGETKNICCKSILMNTHNMLLWRNKKRMLQKYSNEYPQYAFMEKQKTICCRSILSVPTICFNGEIKKNILYHQIATLSVFLKYTLIHEEHVQLKKSSSLNEPRHEKICFSHMRTTKA